MTNKGEAVQELTRKRRAGYFSAIQRSDLTQKIVSNDRICSRHFISGKPAALEDQNNPDWLPTLHLGHSKAMTAKKAEATKDRFVRVKVREAKKDFVSQRNEECPASTEIDCSMVNTSYGNTSIVSTVDCNEDLVRDAAVQTEITSTMMDDEKRKHMEDDLEIETLQLELQSLTSALPFSEEVLECDDERVKFYTGLPKYKILKAVFDMVVVTSAVPTKLTPFQEFMLTIIKLRLNSPYKDLAYRFGISVATVSRIFSKWLTMMDTVLQHLIIWPSRESLWKTMPQSFIDSFGKDVTVIIDCFEVFIERPSNLLARAITWSSYKHHNTVKILLGITPQGTVSFVSEAWGGRVSDKLLTESCGILKHLLPGDVVLADRGFNISDDVAMMQAKLHLPAFTRGKKQLNAMEVESTRSIANVRIHVERVIGVVRQKYRILTGTLPLEYVVRKRDEQAPYIDKIVRVCCALCNICDSVVPLD